MFILLIILFSITFVVSFAWKSLYSYIIIIIIIVTTTWTISIISLYLNNIQIKCFLVHANIHQFIIFSPCGKTSLLFTFRGSSPFLPSLPLSKVLPRFWLTSPHYLPHDITLIKASITPTSLPSFLPSIKASHSLSKVKRPHQWLLIGLPSPRSFSPPHPLMATRCFGKNVM